MKYQMILAVEKKNLALRSRQFFTKRFCELYGRKPASYNNNSYGLHFLAPVTRGIAFMPLLQNDFTAGKTHLRFTPKRRNEAMLRLSKRCEFYWNMVGVELPVRSLQAPVVGALHVHLMERRIGADFD